MSDSVSHHRGALFVALVLAVAAIMVLAFMPRAQAEYSWSDLKGPGEGDAWALAYDSGHSVLYKGTSDRGVWKYQGGAWTSTGGGLAGLTVLSMAYDGTNNVLYAGTTGHGVWRCVAPNTSPVWTDMGGGVTSFTIGSLLFDGTRLYAGASDQGVWRCSDPAAATPSWAFTGGPTVTEGSPPASYRLSANALAFDGSHLYAGTNAHGAWRCNKPATSPSWSYMGGPSAVGGSPPATHVFSVSSLVFKDSYLYAGTVGRGVWRCANPGTSPTWTDIWHSALKVNALLYEGTRLYAGAGGAGVHRSDNPSAASPGWTGTGNVASKYTVLALALNSAANTLYAGTDDHGVAYCTSPNTSPSWSGTGGGLSGYTILTTTYDAGHSMLYAGTQGHGVWRCSSPDTTPVWVSTAGSINAATIRGLAYDSARNILYAAVDTGGVWRCTNPSTTPAWTHITTSGEISDKTILCVTYDSVNNRLFAGSVAYGVYGLANPDSSDSWYAVRSWLPLTDPVQGYTVYSLAWDPHSTSASDGTLYAATGGGGVWRHKYPGTTFLTPSWEPMGALLFQSFYTACYDPTNDDLYVGSLGVLRCHNPIASSSWTRILSIASAMAVHSLARDPASNTLYAGVNGMGVWRCTTPNTSPQWTDILASEVSAYSIAFNGTKVYAGTYLQGVWRCDSPSSGVPDYVDSGGGVSDNTVTAVAHDNANNVVFAATRDYHGVWRCDTPDTTPDWTNLGGEVANFTIKSLAYDGTHLYAGTYENGVWRCDGPLTGSPSWTNISGAKLNAVLALAADNVWVVGATGTILHYDGSGWSREASGTSYDLCGIAALAANDIWAVGAQGTILHYNGSTWAPQASGITIRLNGVKALDGSHVWAVGDYDATNLHGTILRYNGSSWSSESVAGGVGNLMAVVPFAANDVWVVGHEGIAPFLETEGRSSILHYDGSSWIYVMGDTQAYLRGLTAIDSSHMWSAGGALEVGRDPDDKPIVQSSIFFYNSSSWARQAAPNGTSDLYGISALAASDVWAVGNIGNVLHFDGSSWSRQDIGLTRRLNAVSARVSNDIWAVGDGGLVIHYDGSWSTVIDGIGKATADSLAYDSSHDMLYAGLAGKGVWRCTQPATDPAWDNTDMPQVGGSDLTANALLSDGTRLYAATAGHGVWRCADPTVATPSWANISDALWSADSVFSLASDGTHLYAGHQGVWRCDDPVSSSAWTDTGGAVDAMIVRSLAYDGADDVLLAGADANGVWRCIHPSSSPIWLNAAGSIGDDVIPALAYDGARNLVYSGTVGAGLRVASVDPIPTVISCNPTSGYKGKTMDVALTGAETNFTNGVSGAVFGAGITVNSTGVTGPTSATANITIHDGAAAGTRDVKVVTGGETAAPLAAGFTVVRPRIAAVSPASWPQGQTIDVMIWGDHTHFVQGTSHASFGGSGITVNSTRVTDATHARANITVSQTATPGTRAVNVVTGAESPDPLTNKFKVLAAKPHIDMLYPKSGPAGTVITIMGKNFGQSRGSSKVVFAGGMAASSYSYWSPTLLKCTVPTGGGTGGVKVVTPGGTSNGSTFTVTSTDSPTGITSTWYLAEGTTDYGFETYITIANPNDEPVTADITYMTKNGPKSKQGIKMPALSQTTIDPRPDVGSTDFSTNVVCTTQDKPIAVDRQMSWTGPGAASPEGHSSIGVTAPATAWYLPEGSSAWGFETWLLIQNPNDSEAPCTITYMVEGEGPRTVTKNVPAMSRASFNMADDIGAKDASIKVESPVPVIPERSMYRNNRREGHESIGTTAPTNDYYLAEGTTNYGFTTYVLVQNPNDTAADVTVTYMTGQGPKPQAPFTMPPNSRKTILVNGVLPQTDFSTTLHGTLPIIAERSMYWGGGTRLGEACHDSIGMSQPHLEFYLPDGETANGRETYVLVQNPNASDVTVEITYMTPTGSGNQTFEDTIPANSRKTYNMADKLQSSRAAIHVKSKTAGNKIMVERAMYWNSRGAGTDTIGGFSD